ncbi:zinc ABC transporter permease subunit ZnuB [Hahella ganghwensis]|uniref:zinc ABC transporter permease subunit ZnuB n=1 Tax=Hahella ganghwensis TaxID=286420 RepID=UPI00035E1F0C|nr:zinc ABC transporter permease subunit ZnuB [Hahella ganghwensis]
MLEILLPALLGGIGLALITGPLGCFVVWRRMSYFGDTLAHSALMGVVLGLLLEINMTLGIVVGCALMALILGFMQNQKQIATDTLLGILAHSSLSLGLVVLSFMPRIQIDLMGYLFGDLLALTFTDVGWIYLGAIAVMLVLFKLWRALLLTTLHEELAAVEGINIQRTRIALMLMMSLVIALAMKVVGVLLVTSLLIIPAATARFYSNTPERMALSAAAIGVMAVLAGLSLSWLQDTPTGPSVVVSAFIMFLASFSYRQWRQPAH